MNSTFVHDSDFANYEKVDGLVMADIETFYAHTQANRPKLLGDNDCRKFYSDCTCSVCQKKRVAGEGDVQSIFDKYIRIVPSETYKLSRHMYLLCPSEIPAFIFKWRVWRKFCCSRGYSLPVRANVMV